MSGYVVQGVEECRAIRKGADLRYERISNIGKGIKLSLSRSHGLRNVLDQRGDTTQGSGISGVHTPAMATLRTCNKLQRSVTSPNGRARPSTLPNDDAQRFSGAYRLATLSSIRPSEIGVHLTLLLQPTLFAIVLLSSLLGTNFYTSPSLRKR